MNLGKLRVGAIETLWHRGQADGDTKGQTKGLREMELYRKKNNRYLIVGIKEIAAAYIECTKGTIGSSLKSPSETEDFLKARLAGVEHEVFSVIYLDNRHRVIEYQELFRGTIDGTSVYPREVVKESLARNAAAIILAHNHPSGVSEPSQADERITKRLKAALELVDIRVLDHIIVGSDKCTSLASRGLL